ncbi:MAG: 50S ribosomal protein L25 [Pirellulaceae bacterium]
MTDVLHVEKRETTGTAATRRMRRAGRIPAVLYGHGEKNEHLSVAQPELEALLRHHARTVKLDGAVKETALVSDMQWDPLGIEVLHLDLIRVNLTENVEVTVPIHLHGEAIGTREGGTLIENLHAIDIRCSAGSIPDEIEVVVNDLNIGDSLSAGDLTLPSGVELLTPAEEVVLHVEELIVVPEEEEMAATAEPEVIGREAEEEEGEKQEKEEG